MVDLNLSSFQVNLFYHQLEGIEVGWQYAVKRSLQDYDIDHSDFL